MNKDQKLLAEAYNRILKEASLNSTVDLEAIADFLNQNDVWSGAPAKGSGGWFVHNSEVVNDDAEGGYTGISVKLIPSEKGLTAYNKKSESFLFPWPVKASDIEAYMQQSASGLQDEDAENITSTDFIQQIKSLADRHTYFIGKTNDGKLYAVIAEYDRYSDGDRWIDEENYYYQVEGEEKGKYISDKQAKELIKQIAINHPELNKHVYQEVLNHYRKN
jgi:hypothetical protein